MGEPVSNPFRIFAQSNAPALPYVAESGDYIPIFLINSNVAFLLRLANKADRILQEGDPYGTSPKFTAEDAQTLRSGASLLLSHVQQRTPLPEDVLDQFRSVHSSLFRIATFFVERMAILRKREEEATQLREGMACRLEFLYSSGRHLELLSAFPNQADLVPAQKSALQRDFSEKSNVISFTAAQTQRQKQNESADVFAAFLRQLRRSGDWAKYSAPVSTLDAEIRAFQQERNSSGRIHAAIKDTAMRIVTELLAPPTNVIPLRPCRNCG
jgi:hypothetical protein